MGWRTKKGEVEEIPQPPTPPAKEKIMKEIVNAHQTAKTSWGVVSYPPTEGALLIRNTATGEELTLMEAIAVLLERTED